ncbi:hypothetical protein BESB_081990 [Besnoitia besnoiti]|uniref:SRS domain-containing protein n=1 Tax=Besnoitia besnoiti TaxID=94643 RepID=A0A2A9MC79_BESBE|nr:hypothetical protein BESB_081990 [Besnoitia besnoiti]PFH33000.1 hypothetical protein BESB_081990 [Besnoitia besnoiti]
MRESRWNLAGNCPLFVAPICLLVIICASPALSEPLAGPSQQEGTVTAECKGDDGLRLTFQVQDTEKKFKCPTGWELEPTAVTAAFQGKASEVELERIVAGAKLEKSEKEYKLSLPSGSSRDPRTWYYLCKGSGETQDSTGDGNSAAPEDERGGGDESDAVDSSGSGEQGLSSQGDSGGGHGDGGALQGSQRPSNAVNAALGGPAKSEVEQEPSRDDQQHSNGADAEVPLPGTPLNTVQPKVDKDQEIQDLTNNQAEINKTPEPSGSSGKTHEITGQDKKDEASTSPVAEAGPPGAHGDGSIPSSEADITSKAVRAVLRSSNNSKPESVTPTLKTCKVTVQVLPSTVIECNAGETKAATVSAVGSPVAFKCGAGLSLESTALDKVYDDKDGKCASQVALSSLVDGSLSVVSPEKEIEAEPKKYFFGVDVLPTEQQALCYKCVETSSSEKEASGGAADAGKECQVKITVASPAVSAAPGAVSFACVALFGAVAGGLL